MGQSPSPGDARVVNKNTKEIITKEQQNAAGLSTSGVFNDRGS
jgi:hypothetical protein